MDWYGEGEGGRGRGGEGLNKNSEDFNLPMLLRM